MGNLDIFKYSEDSNRRMGIRFRNVRRYLGSKSLVPVDAKEKDIPPVGGPTKEEVKFYLQIAQWAGRLFGISSHLG